MHYLTLDTNTWIYLANGIEPGRILHYLKRQVESGNITILLPELVVEEWNQNKDHAVKLGTLKHFTEITKALNRIDQLLGERTEDRMEFLFGEDNNIEYFRSFIGKFKHKKKEVEDAVTFNIDLIDELFRHPKTTILKTRETILLKAAHFALKKKAPFLKKNSFADAVIVFSFIDYVKQQDIKGAFFITYNTEDFCEKKDSKKNLHPDLVPDFTETSSHFYYIVGAAINTIEQDIVSKQELEVIEQFQEEYFRDDLEVCKVCLDNLEKYHMVDIKSNPVDIIDERETSTGGNMKPLSRYHKMNIGTCDWCNTLHFKCPQCGNLNSVEEIEFDDKKYCEGCYLIFNINSVDDFYGEEERIFKIVDDTETCIKCGEVYKPDGSGTGLCLKCENEYSYQ